MKQLFAKVLNNTELGKKNTHECYVHVSTNASQMDTFFDAKNINPHLIDKSTNKKVAGDIHITKNREFRINGLGQYYAEKQVCAGDKIIFEKDVNKGNTQFFVSIQKEKDSMTFVKKSGGFENLNPERAPHLISKRPYIFNGLYNYENAEIEVLFKEAKKIRLDSPDITDLFSLKANSIDLTSTYKDKDILILKDIDGIKALIKAQVWEWVELL